MPVETSSGQLGAVRPRKLPREKDPPLMCSAGGRSRSRPIPSQEPPPQPSPPTQQSWRGTPQETGPQLFGHLETSEIQRKDVDATTRRHIEENGRTEGSRGKTTANRPSEQASSPIRYAPHGCWCGVRPGPPHHQGTVGIPGWVGGKAIRRGSPSLIQNGIGHLASTDEPRHTLH